MVDERIETGSIRDSPVLDDDSFLRRYKALTKIIVDSAEECFGRITRFKTQRALTSTKIQALTAAIRQIGGAIRHIKSGFTAPLAYSARHHITVPYLAGDTIKF
ncbi:hypothetical protein B0H13DRAFT_1851012 [Mycena leptocephala]|nr:hypothetical protein B0H13DRAFT_1851012 [Mycena leptocephala]